MKKNIRATVVVIGLIIIGMCVGAFLTYTIMEHRIQTLEKAHNNAIDELKQTATIQAQQAYENGCNATTEALTPTKLTVTNKGAMITFRDKSGYFLQGKAVCNKAVRTIVKTRTIVQTRTAVRRVKTGGNTGLNYNDIAEIKKDENGYTTLHLCDEDYSKTVKKWEDKTGGKAEK